jgi:hypothetical protein
MLGAGWTEVVALVAAFAIAVLATPAGISGAVLLLPFQVSVLGTPSPAVTPTTCCTTWWPPRVRCTGTGGRDKPAAGLPWSSSPGAAHAQAGRRAEQRVQPFQARQDERLDPVIPHRLAASVGRQRRSPGSRRCRAGSQSRWCARTSAMAHGARQRAAAPRPGIPESSAHPTGQVSIDNHRSASSRRPCPSTQRPW